MLTCKEAAALVSQSLDRQLSRRERWGLRLHLFICTACTRFKRQAEFLRRVGREYASRGMQAAAQQWRLSTQARARIQAVLSQRR